MKGNNIVNTRKMFVISLDIGVQLTRSSISLYPLAHEQTKLPGVFLKCKRTVTHLSLFVLATASCEGGAYLQAWSQGESSAHSSTSAQAGGAEGAGGGARQPARHQHARPTARSVQLCGHPPLRTRHSFTSTIFIYLFTSERSMRDIKINFKQQCNT